jgi:EAL domain-containing protein (putative c-di-GMP-specific phosphodiesterase class I)
MPPRLARHDEQELVDDLGSALERDEFRLEYQPVVRLGGATVVGAEALIRWRHPRRGTLAPSDFLPAAERAGLLEPIGAYVLEQACRTAAGWPRLGEVSPQVSVNVAPVQLTGEGVAEQMLATVARSGLAPSSLILELTASVGTAADAIAHTLSVLREAGVRVALDDFGSATSLRDLKRLHVDYVKLDREFVVDVDGPPEVSTFSIAVLNLADARGAEAVAKGIESREQAWRLAELGCRYGQGFFFSKPLGATGMVAVLRKGTLRN